MTDFLVTWVIDAENLPTPLAAARYARNVQVRPGTIATVFTVTDKAAGITTTVDLDDEESCIAALNSCTSPDVIGGHEYAYACRGCRFGTDDPGDMEEHAYRQHRQAIVIGGANALLPYVSADDDARTLRKYSDDSERR
jgi:hypothetical protein